MNTRPQGGKRAAWFDMWLRLFIVGMIGSLATVALAPISQIAVMGAVTLVCALCGSVVCAIGLANYAPARWRELQGHVTGLGESLHSATEALGEPRAMARVTIEPPARSRRTL